MMHNKQIWC